MRWLLPPLLLLALLAPRQECPARPIIPAAPAGAALGPGAAQNVIGAEFLVPPLRAFHPAAPLGTDRVGRDAACLLPRGLGRSLVLSLGALLVGALPGVALGLWWAWRARVPNLPSEVLVLLALLLLLGREAFRVALVLGVVLVTARLVAVRASAALREPFVEGALALGGGAGHILRRHVWPHLRPSLPVILATTLSSVFVWLMELGALGFHDLKTLSLSFTDGLDRTPDAVALPLGADLGQLISYFRWTWLDTPEQLAWPVLLLTLLTLGLKDLVRWWSARSGPDRAWEGRAVGPAHREVREVRAR